MCLPMWHPIRLAEDYAMADIVTDGRIVMGVGRGYHTREVESFGAPLLDAEKNRDLFEEGTSAPAEMLQRAEIPPQGPLLRGAAAGAVPRLHGRGHHPGAAAEASAGRHLHADRQRQDHRDDGEVRPQGDGDAQRREDPRRRAARIPGRVRQEGRAEKARRGRDLGRRRVSRGARRPRRSRSSSPRTTSASSGSRRSDSSGMPTSRAASGARPARRRACRSSPKA